jgi:hypothetical protein
MGTDGRRLGLSQSFHQRPHQPSRQRSPATDRGATGEADEKSFLPGLAITGDLRFFGRGHEGDGKE